MATKTWHPIRRAKKIAAWEKKRRANSDKRRVAREKKRAAALKKAGTPDKPKSSWWDDLMGRVSAAFIDWHMDSESATGFQNPVNPFVDRPLTQTHKDSSIKHAEKRSADVEERKHKRGRYLCAAHDPPQRFATPAKLAKHIEDHDAAEPQKAMPEPTAQSPKAPAKTRAPRPAPRPVKRKVPDEAPVQTMKSDQRDLNGIISQWVPHIDQIKEGAVRNVGATTGIELLGEIGSTPIQSVSQVRELAVALEQLGLAIEEGVTGFRQNARQSPQAPIDEEVLKELQQMVEGGAQVAHSAVKFLAAFEEFYGPEIRKAQNEERMSNAALTN